MTKYVDVIEIFTLPPHAARGILRSARSASSGQVSRASRCASAVTFKLPSEHNTELDDGEMIDQQSPLSDELRASELRAILERIQNANSIQNNMNSPLFNNEEARKPVPLDFDLFSKQCCEKWLDNFEDWCIEEQMTVNVMLQVRCRK